MPARCSCRRSAPSRKGQYEGGYAIGLSNGQTMRLVVLPQLIRIALPGLANLWLILLKDTALVSVDRPRRHAAAEPASRRASPSMRSCSSAWHAWSICAWPSSRPSASSAIERALGRREAATMSADEPGRLVERPPPRRARLAAPTHRRLCAGRPVDCRRPRPRRLSGSRLEPGALRQICAGLSHRARRDTVAGRASRSCSARSCRSRSPMPACRRNRILSGARLSPMSISSAARRCWRRPS